LVLIDVARGVKERPFLRGGMYPDALILIPLNDRFGIDLGCDRDDTLKN
jgi:hypothetical protein